MSWPVSAARKPILSVRDGTRMLEGFEPLAVTVPNATKYSGLGRTKLYELIAQGKIKSTTVGKRRLIDFASLKAFLTGKEA
jgi:excisionase family DNA binding protein